MNKRIESDLKHTKCNIDIKLIFLINLSMVKFTMRDLQILKLSSKNSPKNILEVFTTIYRNL